MNKEVFELLALAVDRGASDLHLAAGNPPLLRVHGVLDPLPDRAPLTDAGVRAIIQDIIGEERLGEIENVREFDGSFALPSGHRIRINVYIQNETLAAALRVLPSEFYPVDKLGLPKSACMQIIKLHQGLVLVTGATGSGKTTTIASLVNEINRTRPVHIHTIEDPIEYVHVSKRAFVTQREVGRDSGSFAEATRRSLRQDPDVVVIGEMRDTETMETALTLAETGHLTFATLHTSNAVQTISRVISAFPAEQQPQIRIQLATTLAFVICQQLIPKLDNEGRSLAAEVLVVTPAVRALIRENKTHQLRMTMQTGCDHDMSTMNQSLGALVKTGMISKNDAMDYSDDKQELVDLMQETHGN
ncbi:MAG: type IV pilus twitching motility protein PilT [Candidatus Sumerlaeia bacterium]